MTSEVGVQDPQGRNLGTCGLEISLKRRTQFSLTLMSFPESTARVLEGSQAPGLLTHHQRHPPPQSKEERSTCSASHVEILSLLCQGKQT